jgi:hypothetical protein
VYNKTLYPLTYISYYYERCEKVGESGRKWYIHIHT